jgi:hypothetical protein
MSDERKIDLEKLSLFCQQNASIDFRAVDFSRFFGADNVQWLGFEDDKENLIHGLKKYQRMLWIVPKSRDHLAIKLLENDFLSPVQIANTPQATFIENSSHVFGNDRAIAEKVYARAVKLVQKASQLQQEREQQADAPSTSTPSALKQLETFLEKNKNIDFRTADLLHDANLAQYQWADLESEKEPLTEQLKAYQRMLRVVPSDREDLAKKLLLNGIQSSLQITNIPKKVFIQEYLSLFDDDPNSAEQVYMRALALRKAVTLQYVARMQQAESVALASSAIR